MSDIALKMSRDINIVAARALKMGLTVEERFEERNPKGGRPPLCVSPIDAPLLLKRVADVGDKKAKAEKRIRKLFDELWPLCQKFGVTVCINKDVQDIEFLED